MAMNYNRRRRMSWSESEVAVPKNAAGRRYWYVTWACELVSKEWGRQVTQLELYRWTKDSRDGLRVRYVGGQFKKFICYDFELEAWARNMRRRFPDGVPEPGWIPYNAKDESVVYFVQGENGLIKIGVTRSISKRLAELTTMSPVPIRLLFAIPGDRDKEQELHLHFGDIRRHGEWFDPDPSLLKFIESKKAEIGDSAK